MLDDDDVCTESHCDTAGCYTYQAVNEALDNLTRWHNENHTGPLRYCREQPCDGITNTLG